MSDVSVERQRDAVDRLERLLERAQRYPQTPIGDQTIVAELLGVREDLRDETKARHEREKDFVTHTEMDQITHLPRLVTRWVLRVGTAGLLAAWAWWLGTHGGGKG